MYLNIGTTSYISGFLQAFLKENFDETVEVSNVYNKNTHKALLSYMEYPEIHDISVVISYIEDYEITISSGTHTLGILFVIQNNINNIALRSKATYSEELDRTAISDGLFTLKSLLNEYGWFLTYYIDDNNRFIVHITPANMTEYFPRKEICSMVNMAGLDYIDNYYIKNTTNPSIVMQTESVGIYTTIIDRNTPVGTTKVEIEKIYANPPICNEDNCKKLPKLLHIYFKTSTSEYGFGDESEFFNSTSFKFKLSVMSSGEITSCSYIDSNNKENDMSGYSALTDITNILKTTFTSTENRADIIIQIFFVPNKKRIYFITGIEDGKYYALSHPYDFAVDIKYVFSSEEMSSKKIREQFDPHLITSATEKIVKKGEVILVKAPEDPENKVNSLLVSISVPVRTKRENYEVGAQLSYGDLDQDGELTLSDLQITEEYETTLSKYSCAQKLEMKSKEGLYERTADYSKITTITSNQLVDTQNRINAVGMYEGIYKLEDFYAPVQVEVKPIYLYVGRVSDYLIEMIEKYGLEGKTIEERILQSFQNLNFNENPFLVHSKFIDFLLDSSIHKYSEEHRIKNLYDLVGYDEPYNGYTDDLKKIVYDFQRKANDDFESPTAITFASGYPDVETLYYMKEGT